MGRLSKWNKMNQHMFMSLAWHRPAVTSVLMHWSYCRPMLSHQYNCFQNNSVSWAFMWFCRNAVVGSLLSASLLSASSAWGNSGSGDRILGFQQMTCHRKYLLVYFIDIGPGVRGMETFLCTPYIVLGAARFLAVGTISKGNCEDNYVSCIKKYLTWI